MRYVSNAKQMQEIDEFTIDQVGIPAMVLMENAAREVVQVVLEKITKRDRVIAVCGTGNNGGDGIAVARILKHMGYQADIWMTGEEKKVTEQTKLQLKIARHCGVNIFNNIKLNEYTIVIDAIFGVGLTRPVQGAFETIITEINKSSKTVYSVDLPSGISADTGKIMNVAVKADYTITFGLGKIGLILYPGCEYAGSVTIADIGFPDKAINHSKCNHFVYDTSDLKRLPIRQNYSNKGTFGNVLIIAGSKNMCGACYLSAKAAYRTGAGLVKILTVEDNRPIIQTSLPEAILLTYDPGNLKSKIEIDKVIQQLKWADAVVIGPGIGLNSAAEQLLGVILQYTNVPTLIDADALTILSNKSNYVKKTEDGEAEFEISLSEHFILTPHLKEMERLSGKSVTDISENLISTGLRAVKDKEYTLVLKDARTVVTKGEKVYINTTGNNGMATGGSGDVLTGIIGGLLAQGMEQFEASALGVYIHGLSADLAAKRKSKYSLIAGDIIEALPEVFLNIS